MWRPVQYRNLFGPFLCLLLGQVLQPAIAAEDAWGGIRLFEAELSAANQTTVTNSPGSGLAKLSFDIQTMTIEWEVRFDALTSAPTGMARCPSAAPARGRTTVENTDGLLVGWRSAVAEGAGNTAA